MKLISIVILLISFIVYRNVFCSHNILIAKDENNYDRGFIFKVPQFQENESWQIFHSCIFEFPKLLKIAASKNMPLLLVISDNIENTSTLSNISPWIEGARVALTWAGVYFRFKNLGDNDIRVLRTSYDNLDNKLLIKCLLTPIKDNTNSSLEEQMQKRVFKLDELKPMQNINNITLKSFNFINESIDHDKNKTFLKPSFATKKEKKVIVISGTAGFIGCHITRELLKNGYQVIGLDSLICGYENNLAEFVNDENFRFFKLDITNPFEIEGNVTYVLHLASVPSPEFYYNLPIETLTSGLEGTKQMLELAIKKNARFLFSSTSEVYGDAIVSPQSEDYAGNVNPIGKRSQYDESKRGAEVLIKLYYEKYKLDIRIARIFNTYGPYMYINDGRVVTNFCRAILQNKPMIMYGDGSQTRSFCYITDLIDGLLKLLFNETLNNNSLKIEDRVFNLGNDQEFTIMQLAEKMEKIAKDTLNIESSIKYVPNIDLTDPKQRKPDLTKAKNILGYNHKVFLDEGIKHTLLYFKNKN